MGWQDDPIAEDEQQTASSPWTNDPVADSPGPQAAPMPSMGEVALNAVPKGVANLLNTPITLGNLLAHGIEKITGAVGLTGAADAMKFMREGGELDRNLPMEAATKAGVVDPSKDPQTGWQRIIDTAIQSAIGGAGMGGGVVGAAMGAMSGVASQATKEATGSDGLALAVGLATPSAVRLGLNAGVKAVDAAKGAGKTSLLQQKGEETFRKARAMGMVVEPSKVRGSSDLVESVAGKARIAQETVERNAQQTTLWSKRALGLPDDVPLSREFLKTYKEKVIAPYREVDEVFKQAKATGTLEYFPRYHSQSLTDEFVEASQDAKSLWRTYSESATKDINVLKAAKAADAKVRAIEQDIEMVATHAGVKDLPKRVASAKQLYAKVHDVETALNPGSGHVSPEVLATLRTESDKLTGVLRDLGDVAVQFPRSMRAIERSAPSGVSGTDAGMGATLATMGAAASGNVTGLLAGGLPLLRGPAMRHVLSSKYQDSLLDVVPRLNLHIPKYASRAGAAATANVVTDKREKE